MSNVSVSVHGTDNTSKADINNNIMSDRENNISENDKAILTKFIEFAAWADDHMTEIEDREIAKDIEGMLIHLGLDFNTYLEGMNTIDELLK